MAKVSIYMDNYMMEIFREKVKSIPILPIFRQIDFISALGYYR